MATSNAVISEGQVTFKKVEGHKHDGLTSSLIDTSKYSMFDFVATENAKDATKAAKQQNNKNVLKTFIIDTVEGRVLNPEGIRIQANAISAREIIAGTITADELSSNIVLVDNVIRSKNFINNTTTHTGWAIYSNGTGIFNNVQIRGSLIAGDGYYAAANTALFANIGGYFSLKDKLTWNGSALTIKGTLQFPDGSTPGTFDNGDSLTGGSIGGITIGGSSIRSTDYDANPTTAGFAIYSDGTAIFNEVTVRGTIYAGAGDIGGWSLSSSSLYKQVNVGGNVYTSSLSSTGSLDLYGEYQSIFAAAQVSPGLVTINGSGGETTIKGSGVTSSAFYGDLSGNVRSHEFNISGGIRFPDVHTVKTNMPTGNYLLNLQFANPNNMYVMADNNNNSVHTWATSTVSDRRTKDNITLNINNSLQKFYSLSMYEFEYNENRPWAGSAYTPTGEREIGLIADEVEPLFPNAVIGNAEVCYQQVNYQEFCTILIGASLDQNKRLKELEARIQALEGV